MTSPSRISVLGAGAFGTAIAHVVAGAGHDVTLLCHGQAQADEITGTRLNRRYFPDHALDDRVTATADRDRALDAEMLFLAFPARALDEFVPQFAALPDRAVAINLIKGLHPEFFTFASFFAARLPHLNYVTLKGPTFARPMFLGELSGMTCGASDPALHQIVGGLFGKTNIVLDYSSEPEAVDLISAVKNVYAVAVGISASLGLSDNTTFLLVTRIIKEIRTITDALAVSPEILFSYSGLGDILLTGLCDTSRNRTLGFMLGRGLHIDTARSGFPGGRGQGLFDPAGPGRCPARHTRRHCRYSGTPGRTDDAARCLGHHRLSGTGGRFTLRSRGPNLTAIGETEREEMTCAGFGRRRSAVCCWRAETSPRSRRRAPPRRPPAPADPYAARVARILKATPLIDGHNDWPEVLREREGDKRWTMDLRRNLDRAATPYNTDIARLRARRGRRAVLVGLCRRRPARAGAGQGDAGADRPRQADRRALSRTTSRWRAPPPTSAASTRRAGSRR